MVATDENNLLVISGMCRSTHESPTEPPGIDFLKDINVYSPTRATWENLGKLPRAVAGASSPAPVVNGIVILAGGGIDADDLVKPLADRDPFDSRIRLLDLTEGECTVSELQMRPGVAVAPVVHQDGECIILSGETRAGTRTPEVQRLSWK